MGDGARGAAAEVTRAPTEPVMSRTSSVSRARPRAAADARRGALRASVLWAGSAATLRERSNAGSGLGK